MNTRKTFKKWGAGILAFLLTVSTLGACSNSAPSSSSTLGSNPGVESGVAESKEANNTEGDSGKSFSVLTMRWGAMGDTFTKNQWIIDLEERTGVAINWQVVSSNDWGEQKSIMLAGGSLPDIIFGNQTFQDGDIINNIEYFLPLDDLIENHMPNYQKALEAYPDMKKVTTFPDGKIYSLAKNLPARPITCNQPIVNKVWLDNLGLEVPTTLDELTGVLRAFKEQDANGNGDPNDEFPIAFDKDYSADHLNPFGIGDYRGNGMMFDAEDNIIFVPMTEQYKEGIKWLASLYAEGIIDPESFTQDSTVLQGKNQNDEIALVGFTYAWSHDAVFGKWSSEYIAIAPIQGPDGKIYAFGDHSGVHSIQRNEVEITTFCEDPEGAAAWVDNFYDSEASIQNFWGAIGTVITKNDDGTYTLNDPPEGTSADAWYWEQSLRDFGPKFIEPGFSDKIKLNPEAGDGLKVEISKMGEEYVIDPFPAVINTAEETDELSLLSADIFEYAKQKRAQWITAGGIDEEWDAYIEQMKTMGADRYVEIMTDAYTRMK